MWEITLDGNNDILQELSKVFFGSDPTIIITNRDDHTVLLSCLFDGLSDYNQVKERAQKLITTLNGVLVFILNSDARIGMGTIMERQANGHLHQYVEVITAVNKLSTSNSVKIQKADGTIIEHFTMDPLPLWIDLVKNDAYLSRAFTLMDHDFSTWCGLYKINEVIEEGGCSLCGKKGSLRKDFDRLKRTAESYSLLGVLARHASNNKDSSVKHPMPDPMTLDEAKVFTRQLMQSWINEKLEKKNDFSSSIPH